MKSRKPLLIYTELSEIIGLQASIVLKQIDYWVRKNEGKKRNFFEGKYWTYNTYEEWRKQFPFWVSECSVRRWIKALVRENFLLKRRGKHRIWLTINYERVNNIDYQSQKKIRLSASKNEQVARSHVSKLHVLQPHTEINNTEIPLTEDNPSGTPLQTLSNVSKTENSASENRQPVGSKDFGPSASASYPGWQYDRVLQRASEILSDDYAGIDYLETHEKDKASECRGIKILFDMGFSYKDVIEGINKLSQQGNPRTFMFRQNDDLNRLLKFMEKKIVPSVGQTGGGD